MKANGYLVVNLYYEANGEHKRKCKTQLVHRLVAMTYLPNSENKTCVDHINRHRFDNRVCNLRWATQAENRNNIVVGRGCVRQRKDTKTYKRSKPFELQNSVLGKKKTNYFKTKQEAEAYQKIVYQLRCHIRRMRGLNY